MKNGKKPTLNQRKRIELFNLNSENWLVVKDCPNCFAIVNRKSGKIRVLEGK